jgi:formylglycine-generating enzyme required for sulfatase activity
MEKAFIRVPETHLPCGIAVPPFEASQFLCSQAPDSRVPRAASAAGHTPWVRISYFTALAACKAAGWSLITELQWLAIAHDAAGQNANWTGGAFGEGKLLQGLRKRSVTSPVSGMYPPDDPSEARWKVLSNGERICDFGGNAWSWVYDDLQGGPDGVAGIVDADSPSVTTAPCDPRSSGMGIFPRAGAHRMVWDDRGLIRGGGCRSGKDAGVFALYAALLRGQYVSVGFRATRQISEGPDA